MGRTQISYNDELTIPDKVKLGTGCLNGQFLRLIYKSFFDLLRCCIGMAFSIKFDKRLLRLTWQF